MKVGIMGMGFVGTAMKPIIESKHTVFCYDPFKPEYSDINVLKNTEVIFICVGTPMNEDSTVNLTYIESALKTIKDLEMDPAIFIKSTVPPGTCKKMSAKYKLMVGSNPEFLRERCATKDMWASDRLIIGGNSLARTKLIDVYYPIFGDDVEYIELESNEAEMVKHVTNAFLASQVGFANEIYNICNKIDINYENIKKAIYFDNRLGRHIDVPGTDGKLGFGGHCLPKDLNALVNHAKENGYVPSLFEELLNFNKRQR